MRLLGGIVYRDRSRPPDASLARAMAARATAAEEVAILAAGPAMIFADAESPLRRGRHELVAAAELDLVNQPEMEALTGVGTTPDLIPRLYEIEGPSGLRRLRGGFAVAVWDAVAETLYLSVDHFGIKRLYYAETASAFAFASRPAALLAIPGLGATPDPPAIYHYLNFGFVPAPWSAFRAVRRLPPGHELVLRAGAPAIRRYWDMTYPEQPLRDREACATTFALAEDAVRRAMGARPAKELGAYLSGGTDSSTVVGLMTRLSTDGVNAFSIGFQEPRYDELGHAELSARHFGATHASQIVAADDAIRALPRLIQAFEEPFGNNSAIGTAACADLARGAGATLLLAGDGGDEIFGGNERYRMDRILGVYRRVPRPLRAGLIEPMLALFPEASRGLLRKVQRYVQWASMPNPRRLYSYEFFMAQEGRELLDPGFLGSVDPEAPWRLIEEQFGQAQATSELNRLLYLDIKLTLGDNDLFKVTRTAEVASIEVRFPLLDLPLVEFTGTWPARYKVRGLEKRYLFKRAFRGLLPAETLAKRKHGFGVPTSIWLKSHAGFRALAGDVLGSTRARQRGYFKPGGLEDLRRRHATDTTAYYGDILWRVLVLELWHRHHLEGSAA